MKKIFLSVCCIFLSLQLSARENPFEITNAYVEESARINEQNESAAVERMQEEKFVEEFQKKAQNKEEETGVLKAIHKIVPVLEDKPKDKTYTKQEVDKLIQNTKNQTKQIVKKELEKVKVEPEQIVYVKPRTDLVSTEMITKELFPFVKVEYNDEKITIYTENKIMKKFTMDSENKIVVDYKGKKSFHMKKDEIQSKSFKSVAVGNHSDENFFRVVVELTSKPSNFSVNYKDNIITISKK